MLVASVARSEFISGDWHYSVSQEGSPPAEVATLISYWGTGGHVIVPSAIDGKMVKNVGNGTNTIDGQSKFVGLTLPDTVSSVRAYALYKSTNLSSVAFGNGLKTVGFAAFGETGLTDLTVPSSVTSLGDYAFYLNGNLTNVTLGIGITSIGKATFANCYGLLSVSVPPGVLSIGETAFANCRSMTNSPIPYGVTNIAKSAYGGCLALSSAVIPDTVQVVGQEAFKECGRMTNVVLGAGLTNIAFGAFAYCDSLRSVQLPPGLKSVSGGLFYKSAALGSVVVGTKAADVGDFAFGDCPQLRSVLFKGNAPTLSGTQKNVFGSSTNVVVYALPEATGWSGLFAGRQVSPFVPAVSSMGVSTNGVFAFSWSGTGQVPMDVQRCSSLSVASWSILQQNVTNAIYADQEPPSVAAFYRVTLP